MNPTLDLFFFDVPLYTALIALACAIGLLTAYLYLRLRARRGVPRDLFLSGAVFVFAASWLGARGEYVALNWNYYAARPDEIAQFGAGGLGLRGALIAGFFALAVFAWLHKIYFWKIFDGAALGLTLAQSIGWIGALARGANYGAVSDSRIALELPDIYGLIAPRWPVQHAAIGFFALLFLALIAFAARHPRAGALGLIAISASVWGNFALGFYRGDEIFFIGNLRGDQMLDAGLGVLALWVLVWKTWRTQREMRIENAGQ
ncbi:MAG: prolipoprotein diacylglyceryl transferase [Chloroflexi bacterium]|nr:prolipoprotein diacylglyceryl transferase [Chloroflexota bacterium]